jgi:hypothetical protein
MAKVVNYLDYSGYNDLIIFHVHVVMAGRGTKIANN